MLLDAIEALFGLVKVGAEAPTTKKVGCIIQLGLSLLTLNP